MALLIQESNATTRVYARSLFESVLAQGGRSKAEEVADELEQLVELTRSQPRLSDILASPTIARDDRTKSIDRMFKGRLSDTTVRFLHVLNERDRLVALPAVAASYDEAMQEKFGIVEVDVTTAAPAGPDMLSGLKARLTAALGKEVVLHPRVEPDMIGGVKIKIGDQLLDGSIATQLRQLKDQLENDGTSKMRARMGKIIGE